MWTSFENGTTLGRKGPEEGDTIRDEEHSLGARVTLERNSRIAPFAITCGIYGWMVHTHFVGTEEEISEYDKMKVSVDEILAAFNNPVYDDRRATKRAIEKIEKIVETYP